MAMNFPIIAAGPVAMALYAGFTALLDELAALNGNVPGPWLDALEDAAIKRAKGVVVEGMPIRHEAALVGAGVEALKAVFADYRADLSGKQ